MALNIKQKRKKKLSTRIKATITALQKIWFKKKKKSAELPQYQKDLRAMTNWQNSQWLRAGAKQENTAKFLAMSRHEVRRPILEITQ